MENLIKEVIELDKKARREIELLEAEKSKISDFVNEKKSEIEAAYKSEARKQIEDTRRRLKLELNEKKLETKSDFDELYSKLEKTIEQKKIDWIDSNLSILYQGIAFRR